MLHVVLISGLLFRFSALCVWSSQPTVQLELQSILQGYLSRNYTTSYQNYNPVWMVGTADRRNPWGISSVLTDSSGHSSCLLAHIATHAHLLFTVPGTRLRCTSLPLDCCPLPCAMQSGIRDSFTLNMRIRIPPHQVVYYR